MNRIKGKLLAPFAALIFAALACGGSQPVTIEEIGVYPGATSVDDSNILALTIAESIRESAGQEAVDVDLRAYTLPEGTSWEMVNGYYREAVRGGDWGESADLFQETDFVSTIGWTRGGFASEQALLVAYSIDPLGGPPFLILALFTE